MKCLFCNFPQVRIWKTNSAKSMFDVFYLRVGNANSKGTALAWHPTKENLLALGTDEGRIGLVDAFSTRSQVNFYNFKHRGQVYNLAWAPKVKLAEEELDDDLDGQEDFSLYSLADNTVQMHSKKLSGKPVKIEDVINKTNQFNRKLPLRSEIAFKLNGGHVAIGNDDGTVEVYRLPYLEIVCTLKSFSKLIQCLTWHPTYVGESRDASDHHNWLAVASNESEIHIWDIDLQLEGRPVLSKPNVVLRGHLTRVIFLSWSPHEEEKLLSVSYDQTAQVWDALKGEPLANFSAHKNRLLCGIWSPIDRDIVMTGGDDSTVFGWNINQQGDKLPKKKVKKSTHDRYDDHVHQGNGFPELEQQLKQPPAPSDNVTSEEGNVATSATGKDGSDKKKKLVKRNYFPLSCVKESLNKDQVGDDCCFIAKQTEAVNSSWPLVQERPHLALFSKDPAHCKQLCKMEAQKVASLKEGHNHVRKDSMIASHQLYQWSGEPGEAVKSAIEANKLSDWHVALAASFSQELWRTACKAYAQQLALHDDPVKASSYYLMVHMVVDAIEVLRQKNFYQAALSIAK